MKKKIILSALLILCTLTITFVSVPKTYAQSIEYGDYYFEVLPEYYIYDSYVKQRLLEMPYNDETESINFSYKMSSPPSTIVNLDPELTPFSLEVSMAQLNTNIELWSTPGFEQGYYFYFKTLTLNCSYTYGNQYRRYSAYELPFDLEYLPWYDNVTGDEVEIVRFFSGYDKLNLEKGYLPTFDGVETTMVEESALMLGMSIDFLERNNEAQLAVALRITYPTYTESLITYVPLTNIVDAYDFNALDYIEDFETYTNIDEYPIYSPMAYFTNIQRLTSDNYQNGYNKGKQEGYSEGLKDGYNAGQSGVRVSFTDWLTTAIGGFLSFEIIPGLSLMSILSFIISLGLLFLILRFFSGG